MLTNPVSREIETCLDLLQTLGRKWNSAKHCHKVLGVLLANLSARSDGGAPVPQQVLPTGSSQRLIRVGGAQKTSRSEDTEGDRDGDKRQKLNNQEYDHVNEMWGGVIDNQEQLWHGQYYHHVEPELNDMLGDNTMLGIDMMNELEYPDIFGQVSWEALFHGNGNNIADMANFRY